MSALVPVTVCVVVRGCAVRACACVRVNTFTPKHAANPADAAKTVAWHYSANGRPERKEGKGGVEGSVVGIRAQCGTVHRSHCAHRVSPALTGSVRPSVRLAGVFRGKRCTGIAPEETMPICTRKINQRNGEQIIRGGIPGGDKLNARQQDIYLPCSVSAVTTFRAGIVE